MVAAWTLDLRVQSPFPVFDSLDFVKEEIQLFTVANLFPEKLHAGIQKLMVTILRQTRIFKIQEESILSGYFVFLQHL
jgi:hypothetical protein